MSAMWAAIVRDRLGIPAYCVAGDLVAEGQVVFQSGTDPEELDHSNPKWDGHSWLAFGGFVGDISVFRTTRHVSGPRIRSEITVLQDLLLREFGAGRGLAICTPESWAETGVAHVPRYVLPDAQVNAVLRGTKVKYFAR